MTYNACQHLRMIRIVMRNKRTVLNDRAYEKPTTRDGGGDE